jgi:hypothetical protein
VLSIQEKSRQRILTEVPIVENVVVESTEYLSATVNLINENEECARRYVSSDAKLFEVQVFSRRELLPRDDTSFVHWILL